MAIELRHLRYVVAVAEELHFTRAAERLYLSQPALSARVREVERELGTRLFRRTTRHVALTPVGEAFVKQARLALRHYEAAIADAREAARGIRGTVRLGFFGAAMLEMTQPLLDAFRRQVPEAELQMHQFGWEDASAGLHSRSTDVAIVRPPFEARGLHVEPLFSEPLIGAVPSGHELATRAGVTIDELLAFPLTVRRTADLRWRDFWSAADHRRGRPLAAEVEIGNLDEEMQAVASGRAMSLTAAAAARFYRRPGVTFVRLHDVVTSTVALAWPVHEPSPLALVVRDIVLDLLASNEDMTARIAAPFDDDGRIALTPLEPSTASATS